MQLSAVRNAPTSTSRKPNIFTDVWYSTGDPAVQTKTQLSSYILRIRDTLLRTVMFIFWIEKKDCLKNGVEDDMLNEKDQL